MNTLITMQYVGTKYHGFQVQQNALSVCEVLQNALEKLYGTRPPVKGCSRTDSGVHALCYCVSFIQPKPIDPQRLPLAINMFLPDDIRVISAQKVADDFHARYSSKSKEYIYRIYNSSTDDVFRKGTYWRFSKRLDVSAMQAAARLLCGPHDFAAYMSAGSKIIDTVRTVHFLTVNQQGDDITIHICADGYLYNMVRIIVGTLIEVGTHRMKAADVADVTKSKDRSKAGDTAPAEGLFLYKVNY
ncbi:MAG: tRNA pseudouridine(38-40) synthase TruA [Ruminococcaceae bacterium]|nr:tRNA pseudouridine(38-40) synthase TruA [Oscillospiraceae bacterium]